jgi:multimeric flavodoxin WrbA
MIPMKTLAFFGSARKEGNTKALLDAFLEGLGEGRENSVEMVDAYRFSATPCKDCRYCWRRPGCVIPDDVQDVYQMIEDADVVVFASPVYFHSVTGPLKVIIDRMQTYWAQHVRKDKPEIFTKKGAFLVTGGAPSFPNQFLGAELVLKGVLNDLNVECVGSVSHHTTDTQPVSEDEHTKAAARDLGRKIGSMVG